MVPTNVVCRDHIKADERVVMTMGPNGLVINMQTKEFKRQLIV